MGNPSSSPMQDQKGTTTSAIVTGGGAGAGLAAFAQTLPEPQKVWLSIAAPALSAIIAAVWPNVLKFVKSSAVSFFVERAKRRAIRRMDEFVEKQRGRLNDRQLTPEAKRVIIEKIAEVELARANQEHSLVAIYVQAAEEQVPNP